VLDGLSLKTASEGSAGGGGGASGTGNHDRATNPSLALLLAQRGWELTDQRNRPSATMAGSPDASPAAPRCSAWGCPEPRPCCGSPHGWAARTGGVFGFPLSALSPQPAGRNARFAPGFRRPGGRGFCSASKTKLPGELSGGKCRRRVSFRSLGPDRPIPAEESSRPAPLLHLSRKPTAASIRWPAPASRI